MSSSRIYVSMSSERRHRKTHTGAETAAYIHIHKPTHTRPIITHTDTHLKAGNGYEFHHTHTTVWSFFLVANVVHDLFDEGIEGQTVLQNYIKCRVDFTNQSVVDRQGGGGGERIDEWMSGGRLNKQAYDITGMRI